MNLICICDHMFGGERGKKDYPKVNAACLLLKILLIEAFNFVVFFEVAAFEFFAKN